MSEWCWASGKRKRRFKRKKDALRSLNNQQQWVQKWGNHETTAKSVYHCPKCWGWHKSSTPLYVVRANRERERILEEMSA
jgi:hypothetical protein